MGFLAPALLAGLAAIGLPVYLHLLRQHRTTPRPFSSLRFFERRIQSSIKHRRLKYKMLLALRALFFAALALAFARPFFESERIASAHGGRTMALLMDDSFSMREADRLERAKQAALATIGGMRGGDRAQVVVFGGPTRLATNFTNDRATLEAAVRGIEPGDGASSFAEAARAVRSLSQSAKSPVEAHLYSDMQKTSAPANFSDLRLPTGAQLIAHPVASDSVPNVAVENVIAPRRLFNPKSGQIQATLVSYSDKDLSPRVSLVLNDRTVESKNAQVGAGGRATVTFTGVDAPYGLTRGEVRIDAADRFTPDNHFNFAIERSDPAPALFVREQNDARSALYFQMALASVNQPAFNVTATSYGQAATTALERFAFVVLSDPPPLNRGFEEALTRYVTHGGSLLVVLGRNSEGHVPVAGWNIASISRRGDSGFKTISRVDTTHPALRNPATWDGVRFYRVAGIEPGRARILMSLDNGSPLLVEEAKGEGRILAFASAFDNMGNDFPVRPIFVPFVQQLTGYLGRLETATGNYTAGSFYDLRPEGSPVDSPIEVTGPGNKRVLSLAESTRSRTLLLEHEGFYQIHRANGRRELAAVNPDRRESDFSILPADTIALWKNTGNVSNAAASGMEASQNKNELWWWVLLLALGLAVAESVLGNHHLRVKEGVQ